MLSKSKHLLITGRGYYLSYILLLIIFIGFFNPVLRLSPNGLSLYRLLTPIQLIVLAFLDLHNFREMTIFFLMVVFCSGIGLLLSGYKFNDNNIIFFFHYLTIFLLYFSVGTLVSFLGREKVFTFIRFSFYILLLSGIMDFWGVEFPNVEKVDYAVRGIFNVENDFSLAISGFIFVLINRNIGFICISPVLLLVLFTTFYNDAKVAFLAIIFAVLLRYVFLNNLMSIKTRLLLFFSMSSVLSAGIYQIVFYEINFPNKSYTLFELIFEPIFRILTLNPFGEQHGSISNRTDMVIYSIKDLISSLGFGIGFGNTLTMLSTNKYAVIGSAKSIHNFPLQIVVELGVFVAVFIIYQLLKRRSLFFITLFAIMLFSSLSQSVGVFSNYFFLFCLFFMLSQKTITKGNVGPYTARPVL